MDKPPPAIVSTVRDALAAATAAAGHDLPEDHVVMILPAVRTRAQGLTLLQSISKEYGIDITIHPPEYLATLKARAASGDAAAAAELALVKSRSSGEDLKQLESKFVSTLNLSDAAKSAAPAPLSAPAPPLLAGFVDYRDSKSSNFAPASLVIVPSGAASNVIFLRWLRKEEDGAVTIQNNRLGDLAEVRALQDEGRIVSPGLHTTASDAAKKLWLHPLALELVAGLLPSEAVMSSVAELMKRHSDLTPTAFALMAARLPQASELLGALFARYGDAIDTTITRSDLRVQQFAPNFFLANVVSTAKVFNLVCSSRALKAHLIPMFEACAREGARFKNTLPVLSGRAVEDRDVVHFLLSQGWLPTQADGLGALDFAARDSIDSVMSEIESVCAWLVSELPALGVPKPLAQIVCEFVPGFDYVQRKKRRQKRAAAAAAATGPSLALLASDPFATQPSGLQAFSFADSTAPPTFSPPPVSARFYNHMFSAMMMDKLADAAANLSATADADEDKSELQLPPQFASAAPAAAPSLDFGLDLNAPAAASEGSAAAGPFSGISFVQPSAQQQPSFAFSLPAPSSSASSLSSNSFGADSSGPFSTINFSFGASANSSASASSQSSLDAFSFGSSPSLSATPAFSFALATPASSREDIQLARSIRGQRS